MNYVRRLSRRQLANRKKRLTSYRHRLKAMRSYWKIGKLNCTMRGEKPTMQIWKLTGLGLQKMRRYSNDLLNVAMLLLTVSVLCSCASTTPVEIKTVPTFIKPVLPMSPEIPDGLDSLYPQGIAITRHEAQFYIDACSAWEGVGFNGYSEKDVLDEYGLDQSAACDWAIYGYTAQGQLTIETIINTLVSHIIELKIDNAFLRQTIDSIYEAVESDVK